MSEFLPCDVQNAKKSFRVSDILLLMILLSFLFLINGCGVKNYPKPPKKKETPIVVTLEKKMEENRLTLFWKVSEGIAERGILPLSYVIYRSKVEKNAVCNNCPQTYQSVAETLFPDADTLKKNRSVISYSETLAEGYRYAFKVSLKTGKGGLVPATRIVQFDF